jgi:uncharacterized protein (DUF1330 family)
LLLPVKNEEIVTVDVKPEFIMRKGYWIAHIDVVDMAAHKVYMDLNAIAFAKYGGKFLVRGGRGEIRSGALRSRHVVIEFPTYEAALACYDSPEYAEAMKARAVSSTGDIVVVEGCDPQ